MMCWKMTGHIDLRWPDKQRACHGLCSRTTGPGKNIYPTIQSRSFRKPFESMNAEAGSKAATVPAPVMFHFVSIKSGQPVWQLHAGLPRGAFRRTRHDSSDLTG